MIVGVYCFIGILLRNYIFCQEVHEWSTRHNPLFSGSRDMPTKMSTDQDGQVTMSPFSILPKLTSGRFAIIVLVILNKLNRHERNLITK